MQTSSHGACCPSALAVLFSRSVFSQAGRPARGLVAADQREQLAHRAEALERGRDGLILLRGYHTKCRQGLTVPAAPARSQYCSPAASSRKPAGRLARRRCWRTVLRTRWGSRNRETLSALGMISAQKDKPISPSLQCLCAMRQLLPLVSCHEAARRPAGLREDAPGEQYCERAGAAGTVRACLHLA